MLCQNCGKNEATTHIKQIINGDMAESHLCSDCASHLGYSDVFSGFGLNLSEFFGGFLGDMMPSLSAGNAPRCPNAARLLMKLPVTAESAVPIATEHSMISFFRQSREFTER